MKFQTHAHRFFDAVRRGAVWIDDSLLDHDGLLPALRQYLPEYQRLPLYVLADPIERAIDRDLWGMAGEAALAGRVRVPHREMLWQFTIDNPTMLDGGPATDSTTWIVYTIEDTERVLSEFPGAILVWVYQSAPGSNLDQWVYCGAVGCIHSNGSEVLACRRRDDAPDGARRAEVWRGAAIEASQMVAAVCLMLDSPSIELEPVRVPKEINRGRRLLKRPVIPDHTIIRLPKVAYAPRPHQGGTHRSPKVHWRLPHRRHYKSGRVADIPLTLVAKREDEPVPPPPVVELRTRKEPR